MEKLLLLLLAGLAPLRAEPNDEALGGLLHAHAATAAAATASPTSASQLVASAFDAAPAAAPSPVRVPPASSKAAALQPARKTTPAVSSPQAERTAFTDGYVGLYPESGFELTTGRCQAKGCNIPREGSWYLLDDVVAVPKAGPPALIWIGSNVLLEGARLSVDGKTITLQDGTVMPFSLAPKIDTNRSYYNDDTKRFFVGNPLRLRGEIVEQGGVKRFVARTIWREDFRIDAASLQAAPAKGDDDIEALVAQDGGGATKPFATRLLWERSPGSRDWAGRPVMGVMLNGAQGDDDESLAGHFSLFTGRYGPNGEMSDWVFNNFYDMNYYSEKGIIPAMVPMDKYMADLNSGQSYYRPTHMLVMILKDPRLAEQVQRDFVEQYRKYYSQELKYNRVTKPCASLIVDVLREDGWNIPEYGNSGKAWANFIWALGLAKGSRKKAQDGYDSALQEKTRLIPRAAFTSMGGDMLRLAGAQGQTTGRQLSPFERMIQEDLDAILFVRLPQIPSSRAFGSDPIKSVDDYFWRAPKAPWNWQTTPSTPRPFPPPGAN